MAIQNYRNKTIGDLNMKDGLAQDQETIHRYLGAA